MKETTHYHYFGDRICKLRKDRGWTQKDLSKKLGKKVSTISAYETNAKFPSIECLITMADLFGVSVDTLINGDNAELLSIHALNQEQKEVLTSIIQELSIRSDSSSHTNLRLELAAKIVTFLAE